MRSPAATASLSRFRMTTPQPSPRTNPFADASNALHWPSGERVPASAYDSERRGSRMRLTPATTARSASPCCNAMAASCVATSEDEQAVSTAIAGPWRPSMKASRPLMPLRLVPRLAYSLAARPTDSGDWSSARKTTSRYSRLLTPVNTPVRVPLSRSGFSPASSSARQVVSRVSRCCGSTICASSGDMRKKAASNRSMSSRNPANREESLAPALSPKVSLLRPTP